MVGTLTGMVNGQLKDVSLRKADIAGGEAATDTSSENNIHSKINILTTQACPLFDLKGELNGNFLAEVALICRIQANQGLLGVVSQVRQVW